jgi:Leucine-rich repeat (LRR) protein
MSLHLNFRCIDEINGNQVHDPHLIEEIYIKFCDLDDFPSFTFRMCNLTHLAIASNNISTIPHEIKLLSNLTYLDISSNKICELISEIFCLEKIEYFDASYNFIKENPNGK